MPPNRVFRGREWSNHEKHLLLCLMARGAHLEHHGTRFSNPDKVRAHAYARIATIIIKESHHSYAEVSEADKRDVARLIDRWLSEKKGVLGQGGYMERSQARVITRGLRRLFERPSKFDYTGSLAEWKMGRKAREMEKARIAAGGAPREEGEVLGVVDVGEDRVGGDRHAAAAESTQAKEARVKANGDYWRQADIAAATSRNKWRGVQDAAEAKAQAEAYQKAATAVFANKGRGSYGNLPANIRGGTKFDWVANPIPKLPPKPTVIGLGREVHTSPQRPQGVVAREGYDTSVISDLVDTSNVSPVRQETSATRPTSYAKPKIPTYGLPAASTARATGATYIPGEFADMRINLPPKPAFSKPKLNFGNLSATSPANSSTAALPSESNGLACSLISEIDTSTTIFKNPALPAKPANPQPNATMQAEGGDTCEMDFEKLLSGEARDITHLEKADVDSLFSDDGDDGYDADDGEDMN